MENTENIENSENTENLQKSKRGRKPKLNPNEVKFYMSLELRHKLKKLLKSSDSESIVYEIAEKLLNLKVVSKDSLNYLGMSFEDYRKVSYLTPDRVEKAKNSFFETRAITPKTSAVIIVKKPFQYRNPESPELSNKGRYQEVYPISKGSFKKLGLNKNKLFYSREKTVSHHENFTLPDGNVISRPVYIDSFHLPHVAFPINDHYEYYYKHIIKKDHPDHNLEIEDYFFINVEVRKHSSLWDPKLRYHASIHKVLEKLFPCKYIESQKTQFLEAFLKLLFSRKNNFEFKLFSGNDIATYYCQDTYLLPENQSTLWKSCMRYPSCEDYFSIYTKNSHFVQLAVLMHNNCVAARALVWYYEDEYYYDRIYAYNDEYEFELEANFVSRNYIKLRDDFGNPDHEISFYLPEHEFNSYRKYPYMDTVMNYFPDADRLSSGDGYAGRQIVLQETEGYLNESVECEICGEEMCEDDAMTIDYGRNSNATVCGECGIYCSYDDAVIRRSDSIWAEAENSYIHEEDAVELFTGDYCHKENDYLECYENDYGYFLRNRHNYNEIDFNYYHPDDPQYYELIAEEEEEEIEEIEENQENQENQKINHESI